MGRLGRRKNKKEFPQKKKNDWKGTRGMKMGPLKECRKSLSPVSKEYQPRVRERASDPLEKALRGGGVGVERGLSRK